MLVLMPVPVLASSLFLVLVLMLASYARRQRGRVVRAPDLKSGGPRFESHSDH